MERYVGVVEFIRMPWRVFATFAAIVAALNLPALASTVDRATYTTIHFRNAPEALLRVESWRRTKDGILLTTRANPCAFDPGGLYQLLVKKASPSTFHKGELLIMGSVVTKTLSFWGVRRVLPSELPGLGGCPRRTNPH
jgi:hypothetical protein